MNTSFGRFAGILTVVLASPVTGGPAVSISEGGKAACVVVVSAEARAPERHAAAELVDFLRQITGADIPLAHERHAGRSNLLVGPRAAQFAEPGFTAGEYGTEGLVIRTVDRDLILAGGEPRGTLYAVYTFLEEVLGCRWYTPHAHVIPSSPTLSLPPTDIVQRPSFEYREVFYSPAFDADWAVRNQCNGQHIKVDSERGGKITYGRWCHTFPEIIRDDAYFEAHPEYFSWVDGKRISSSQHSGQICLTNPDVLKIATDKVFAWIAENQ